MAGLTPSSCASLASLKNTAQADAGTVNRQTQAQSRRVVSGGQLTQATLMAGSMPAAKATYSTVPPERQGYGAKPCRARADCTRHSTMRSTRESGVSSMKSMVLMLATSRAAKAWCNAGKPPPSGSPSSALARTAS